LSYKAGRIYADGICGAQKTYSKFETPETAYYEHLEIRNADNLYRDQWTGEIVNTTETMIKAMEWQGGVEGIKIINATEGGIYKTGFNGTFREAVEEYCKEKIEKKL